MDAKLMTDRSGGKYKQKAWIITGVFYGCP